MRTTLFLLGALLAAAVHAASSKDASYTRSTAVVVRAHPWLTRGLPRESLIGIRFWGVSGAWGGGLNTVTFRLRLKNCTRKQLGGIKLWRMDFKNNYGFYEPRAIRLDGAQGTLTETQTAEDTYTFTFKGDGNASEGTPDWFYPHVPGRLVESDYIWLTAEIDPAISRDAKIYADVTDTSISIGGCAYQVDNNLKDGTVAPHRVYPYKYRNNAYLRADRMRGVRASDILDNASAARLAGLTDVMLSSLKVTYNRGQGAFYLNLNETYWHQGRSATYGDGLRRLTDLRDGTNEGGGNPNLHAAPHLRVFASLDKGPFIQAVNADGSGKTEHAGYDAEGNEIRKPVWEQLDSNGDGAHEAYPLGHAAGSRYRAKLVDDIVAMMKTYNLDGLDIDWEYPNQIRDGVAGSGQGGNGNKEYEKYGLLLRDLSEAFFNHGWELAMCTNLGYQMPGGEVMAVPDFINSMAYGRQTGLHASYAVMVSSALQGVLLSRNVPKRRILVGQAPYGYEWQNIGWSEIVNSLPGDNGGRRNSRPVTDWDVVVANLDRDTSAVYRTNSQTNTSYNGPTTLRGKCNYLRENGYGGVMSWGYYDDMGPISWEHSDWLSAGRNMAQVVWPHDFWPTPPKDGDYYLLDSEEDWFWFQENPNNNVRLAADITFTHDPLPIPAVSRTLDGNGHTLTIPEGVWLVTYEDTALIRELSGTVQDLTIVLDGRIVTRNDRKNDWEYADCKAVPGNGRAAVLATSLSGNGVIRNVTVRIGEHGEVQGAKQAGGVVANAWAGEGSGFTLENVRVDIAGWVRNLADPSGSGCGTAGLIPTDQTTVGGLAAWVGGPGANTVRDCAVTLRPTARLSNASGKNDAVAGCVGHFNNAGGTTVEDLRVSWRGAAITSQESRLWANSPWVTSFNTIDPGSTGTKSLSGSVTVPRDQEEAFRERWPSYWLEATAPLWLPGYRFRLR